MRKSWHRSDPVIPDPLRRIDLAQARSLRQWPVMVPFSFHGEEMALSAAKALYWPRMEALLVADLHLEKASFFARTGQMLPPYDSRETLLRIADLIRRTGARRIFVLGDSFHDKEGRDRLEPHARGMLDALTRATRWTWIVGNHDAPAGADAVDEVRLGGMLLRHCATPGHDSPEISGHFHPKVAVSARGRRISRPCAVLAEGESIPSRLVLPAFGALTGGMNAADPAIVDAMRPAERIDALVRLPLWRHAA
jgi:DNA ligase-associated metallophosphoesterase